VKPPVSKKPCARSGCACAVLPKAASHEQRFLQRAPCNTLERARRGGYLTTEARSIFWSRISEAYGRGDLTLEELERLEALLEIDRRRYLRDLDIAMIGEPEEDA